MKAYLGVGARALGLVALRRQPLDERLAADVNVDTVFGAARACLVDGRTEQKREERMADRPANEYTSKRRHENQGDKQYGLARLF